MKRKIRGMSPGLRGGGADGPLCALPEGRFVEMDRFDLEYWTAFDILEEE